MRRRGVHALFAAVTLGCAAMAGVQALRLQEASRVRQAVAEAMADGAAGAVPAAAASSVPATVAGAASATPAPVGAPEARLARALALARAERYEDALAAFQSVPVEGRDDLRRAVLYDVGNLHLREARRAAGEPVRTQALVELAKQSYRELLRRDPGDWAARYNLERALWLAPEVAADDEEPLPTPPAERAVTTLRSDRGELP